MTIRTLIISSADVARCPKSSLSASHYGRGRDGEIHCACEQPAGWVPQGVPAGTVGENHRTRGAER